ncbi:DNA mismatch repair endonuclease MutL [Candidatus Margulisiibacteriota bacterium]
MSDPRIIILDDVSISKIAAGEVVERPASVVKELIENSIDAGAVKITVEVKNGGRDIIRVTDNGCGMTMEEAKLSFERHSTSKISTSDDLFSITTLGFRGEALPSIASVARFEIITKAKNSDGSAGTKIVASGGKLGKAEDLGCPEGTTVTVEKLFFNTPVRLKFMKSPNTELGHIINIVSKFILSNPLISFRLVSDSGEVLSSPGSGKLVDAIASVYGVDMVDTLVEVKKDGDSKVPVWGYVSQPVISKSDRGGESFFVNGRYVRNALLSRALEDSYRNIIPNGRYPVAVIFINIDPKRIDVNVHPTKREIKFERPSDAMDVVRKSVSRALSDVVSSDTALAGFDIDKAGIPFQGDRLDMFGTLPQATSVGAQAVPQAEHGFSALTQIADTYIVAVKDNELILIDQHAAHERILYEKLKAKNISGSQKLLINLTVELQPSELSILKDNLDYVSELGFELEPFGKNTFMVRAVPSVLEYNQAKEAIEDILSDFADTFKIKDVVKRKEEGLKMLACKGAVKAGDSLTFDEMNNLIRDLYKTEFGATCPHGRPTTFKFNKGDLEKMFKRK